eukprot:CCRYP_011576-RA/>CCRYP_011576-RA protein AED:0.16 eAED:0.16 QI:87/1/1/1/1/1/3/675/387
MFTMFVTYTISLVLLLLTDSATAFHASFITRKPNPRPLSPLVSIQSRWAFSSAPLRPDSRVSPIDSISKMGATISKNPQDTHEIHLPNATQEQYRNKAILLTGASRGLGRSLAHALASCHPSLLILSGRDKEALESVKAECLQIATRTQATQDATHDEETIRVECLQCDLRDKSSVENLATSSLQLAKSSPSATIDILINNGGISSRSSFLETRLEVDERLMQVNFLSGAGLAKAVVPGMVERSGGRIVWISSVQGKIGTPYRTSYAASKFAVQGYCEALRAELASSNVSVHVVSPGYIRTNLSMSAVMGDGKAYSKMDETTANGADPHRVACEILTSVANNKSDFVVAATFSARAALWLKFLAPSFLEGLLMKRFEKGSLESKKDR